MKQSFGLFIDGTDLKIAHLMKKKGKVFIRNLFTSKLAAPLEKEEEETDSQPNPEEELFGKDYIEEAIDPEHENEDDKDTNLTIILDAINNLPVKKGFFGINIPESNVYFVQNGKFKGNNNKKIKKAFLSQINETQEEMIDSEQFEYLKKHDGSALGVYHKGSNYVLEQLEELNNYVNEKIRINLIDVNELALIGYARCCRKFVKDETTALIYLGQDFANIIILKDGDIFHFGDLINSGVNDPSITDTIYSKILLILDEWNIPTIDTILLAGESVSINLKLYLEEKFSESMAIDYLNPDALDTSGIEEEERKELSTYAIPLALAWKVLEPDKDEFYQINFLPERIKSRQNTLKIEWHGYLLLASLAFMSLFFLKKKIDADMTMRNLNAEIQSIESEIQFETEIVDYINEITAKIRELERKNALIDSLKNSATVYSNIFAAYSTNIRQLNSIWIEKFNGNEKNYVIEGISLYRNRVNYLAQKDTLAQIKNLKEMTIRNFKMYEFEIFSKNNK